MFGSTSSHLSPVIQHSGETALHLFTFAGGCTFDRRLGSRTISSKNIPRGSGDDLQNKNHRLRRVCTTSCKWKQIVLDRSSVACFNYSVISHRQGTVMQLHVQDVFIRRLRLLHSDDARSTKKGATANEREPFISSCHSVPRDNLHFEMH